MALIVEDGTGLANAESYCSVADATAYHAARGNLVWANITSDTLREQALRKATDFMLQTYRSMWQGQRCKQTQMLDWPRVRVVVDKYPVLPTIVPVAVVNACAELALRASAGDLVLDQGQVIKSKKIGPIAFEYDQTSSQNKRYIAIDRLLSPYFSGGSFSVALVRA